MTRLCAGAGSVSVAAGRRTSATSVSGSALNRAIESPPNVTARAARVSPEPPQSWHGPDSTKRIALFRWASLCESASVWSVYCRALQNRPL